MTRNGGTGVYLTGFRELIRDLGKLGIDVDELKDVMGSLADDAARLAAAYAPKRTGRLAGSIRGNRAKARATVTAGRGKSNLYAGVQNYGWPARGIRASNYMQRADHAIAPTVIPRISTEIDRLIRQRGL